MNTRLLATLMYRSDVVHLDNDDLSMVHSETLDTMQIELNRAKLIIHTPG